MSHSFAQWNIYICYILAKWLIFKLIQVEQVPSTQNFVEKSETIPPYATNIIPLNKISYHTSYSILIQLLVACSACFAWTEFNAHWLRELGGPFLLVENTPNLLLLQVRLLGAKMGEKSTPADPPKVCRIRLRAGMWSKLGNHFYPRLYLLTRFARGI